MIATYPERLPQAVATTEAAPQPSRIWVPRISFSQAASFAVPKCDKVRSGALWGPVRIAVEASGPHLQVVEPRLDKGDLSHEDRDRR